MMQLRRSRTAPRHRRHTSPVAKWLSILAVAVLMLSGLVTATASATTVYEINGQWTPSTPSTVSKGDSVVSAWRFNINDDSPAPGNATVPNVTVTFTVDGGVFTVLPAVCLTDGVTPPSQISADGSTLTCNLGDRDEGTAELVLTGIQVTGSTGDTVSVAGTIGGQSAVTPELNIENAFAMDMKWDQGNPLSSQSGDYQLLSFPWSLRHAPGAEDGPSSVTYRVTIDASNDETVVARGASLGGPCGPIDSKQPQHPYSSAVPGADSTNTAPFPTCTMTAVAGQPHQFDVTISGIDYSKTMLPTRDTNGTDLSTAWEVVASGMIHFRMTYVSPGTLDISVNAPTYTSDGGVLHADDTANNTNSVAYTRGIWTGGWLMRNMNPPVEGTIWTDTYRQMAGQPALAISSVKPPTTGTSSVCTVLDTRYVTFEWSAVGTISGGVVTPYGGVQPTIEYFTGPGASNVLDPTSANYDPNTWQCNDPSISAANWVTTPPADLSLVKAVRAVFPTGMTGVANIANLYTMTTIKPTAPIGKDIYTWTSFRADTTWFHPDRTMLAADKPANGVLTGPGARYPYTGGGRDVLRVVGAKPVIDKSVGSAESIPGATVGYSVKYRAESPSNAVLPEYTLVDVLPLGTSYVPGSATVPPTSVTTLGNGRVELRWVFDDVSTNSDYFMHYDVVLPGDAEPGEVFVNNATASVGALTASDTARVRIREGGSTFLTKTALVGTVPHLGGVAEGGWTVRLTSQDTARQTFTDTIDVLPYVGDGRGTAFTGSYELDGPVDVSAMPGATVHYTTADPSTISDDPKDASNGAAPGDVSGNTVGWSTTYTPDATAVRVIGGELAPSAQQAFTINIVTEGASYQDVYVNRAQAVTNRTSLVMRTSDVFDIAAARSLTLKKYVQDADGVWRDAQNIDDYPGFAQGSALNYRLVVTNTGDVALTDVALTDDKVDLAGLAPLPAGLGVGAVIAELLPGAANAVTIEYSVPLSGVAVGGTLVNNACAVPSDADVDESCDPAGVTVLPSSLAWTKIAAGTTERLAGSEWELTPVDADDEPTGAAITVTDCVEATAVDCTGSDVDHRAGELRVGGLEAGRYRLVETKAPAGYVLDDTPRFVEVAGDSVLGAAIENEQHAGLVIPFTGGRSAQLFMAVAGTLAALMLLLVVVRRRAGRRERVA